MKKLLALSVFASILLFASCDNYTQPRSVFNWDVDTTSLNLVQFVDPMIGTGGHGHTFPGATAPFGMVQLSPDTRIDGSWDGCSGYHYSDSIIYGFSHTHLSGTGCSDYGDIMLMPVIAGKSFTSGADTSSHDRGYRQSFRHENEHAEAGYYSVKLDNGIFCELTASPRVGVHRYNFYDYEEPSIVLDMSHRDEVLECELEIVNDHTIRGKRFSKAWATNQQLWFYAEFSEPFGCTMWSEGQQFTAHSSSAKDLKAVFSFDAREVQVKMALSPVSWENAKLNLEVETGGMNFDAVKEKVQRNWNAELSRIEVESDSVSKKRIFYTALYHCFIAPNVYCDVNGDYQGMDHKVYRDTIHQRYTVFSLWDTYRALHPLFTIVQQKRTNDFINTFLEIYKESERLPVWELSSNETDCMIGYHSVSVITDAWMKGITGFDTALAYEAMKASAMENRGGLESYRKYGYIPAELEGESVSKTLEYSYDDWCIAQCAVRMDDDEGMTHFFRRSHNWRNLYNPETGFLQARLNNSFLTPFNPAEVNFHYTEANAWQYSLAVQQDPSGLIELHGAQGLSDHLDSLFSVSSKTSGREQADITGLIGQYAHGNEPSHHMAYLYTVFHDDYKTQELVYRICNTLYTDKPDGLCGNEDCGQMSAWYVMSAAGIYSITPGLPEYTIGSPQFASVKFHLENGKTFTINAADVSGDAPYVWARDITGLNADRKTAEDKILQSEIMEGTTLGLKKHKEQEPVINNSSFAYLYQPVVVPWITGTSSRTFTDKMTIGLKTLDPENVIYYSLNDAPFIKYTNPITVTSNTKLRTYADNSNIDWGPTTSGQFVYTSDTATAEFFKAPAWKSIAIRYAYAPQYSAGGDRGLIDGLTGTTNFRTGLWQGYEGVDMDVTIDLGKSMMVDSVTSGFLEDRGAWIFSPQKISIYVGDDTTAMNAETSYTYIVTDGTPSGPAITRVKLAGAKGRYVRVVAIGEKVCPKGHPGEGKPAWLFCDEISIKTK